MPKPICTVMVGLPGLGKSTLVESHRRVYGSIDMDLFVYSTDNIIERIAEQLGKTYNDVFERHIKEATQMCNDSLDSAIADGLDVIFDQTNLGAGKRRKIINRMKQAGYQVCCEYIVPPEAGWLDAQKAWKHRLEGRPGKTIPQHVLSNMIESFVEPTIDEGFDMVTFYSMDGALLGIDYGEKE